MSSLVLGAEAVALQWAMSPAAFEIEIAKQGWLDPDEDDAPADLCSHGDIRW